MHWAAYALSRLYGAPYVPSRLCTELAYVLSRLYSEPPMCEGPLYAGPLICRAAYMPLCIEPRMH